MKAKVMGKTLYCAPRQGRDRERRVYLTKIDTEKLLPEVRTLTIVYTVFNRKGDPFIYVSWRMVPLSHTFSRHLEYPPL